MITPDKVLVVDNDPARRVDTTAALEAAGFCPVASSTTEAIETFCRIRPDLAIVHDVAACRSLRGISAGKDLPILVVADEEAAVAAAFEVGATDFIRLPLPFRLLSFRLRYLIRSARTLSGLRRTQAQLAAAHRIAKLGHWSFYPSSDTVAVSAEAALILGRDDRPVAITWESFLDEIHDEDRHRVRRALAELSLNESIRLEHRLQGPQPAIVSQEVVATEDDKGELCITGTMQDISERKRTERHIVRLAYYDNLTNLPNRTFFWDTLTQLLDTMDARSKLGLVGVHLHGWHRIVDTFGHEAGDHLLQMVAERLNHVPDQTDTLCPEDTVSLDDTNVSGDVVLARINHEGFMFLFRDLQTDNDIWQKVRRIQEGLSEPVDMAGHPIVPAACIGLALFPEHGQSTSALLKSVETAQHRAVAMGAGHCVMFSEDLHANAKERVTMEMALRRAVERDGFELHYQPKVDAASGRPVGMEALLRWTDPDLGRVSPGRFIPIAEESGLIVRLGGWVLRTACAQTLRWRSEAFPDLRVAVNISVEQFLQPDFVQVVLQTLAETGLPPEGLELEITESMLMRDTNLAVRRLTELREEGIRIALDDFGTGYSSLSYLHRFPLDTLKIDRSFVTDMMHKPDAATVVRAIILLSHNLHLRVVAEGVEERPQLEELRKLGCEEIQGYFYSPALPCSEFESWMRNALGHRSLAVGE